MSGMDATAGGAVVTHQLDCNVVSVFAVALVEFVYNTLFCNVFFQSQILSLTNSNLVEFDKFRR